MFTRVQAAAASVAILAIVAVSPAYGQTQNPLPVPTVPAQVASREGETSAYRQFEEVPSFSVKVPTVLEVTVDGGFLERSEFAVYDKTSGTFVPLYVRPVISKEIPVTATSDLDGSASSLPNPEMVDGKAQTYAQFNLPAQGTGKVDIFLTGGKPITTDTLTMLLDEYVALPTSVQIETLIGSSYQIVVARRAPDSSTIRFPKTTASTWKISLTYGQPLRIAELRLGQQNMMQAVARSVRFLGYQGHAYRIYFDPDRYASLATGETPNLTDNNGVLRLSAVPAPQANPFYKMADSDHDGIPDLRDNCVQVANTDQVDIDGNGRGDTCDDFDHDGRMNSQDNCPNITNAGQADIDSDGIGDACDSEESRVTEKYKWLPWVGIGFAGIVLVTLFALTARSMRKRPDDLPPSEPQA